MKIIKNPTENTKKVFECLKSYGCNIVYVPVTSDQLAHECKINRGNVPSHTNYLMAHGYISKIRKGDNYGHNEYKILKEFDL